MTGSLLLAGTTRYVAVSGGAVLTWKGRLIVATTAAERDQLPGRPVPLPPEWISVSEWLEAQGLDPEKVPPATTEEYGLLTGGEGQR